MLNFNSVGVQAPTELNAPRGCTIDKLNTNFSITNYQNKG